MNKERYVPTYRIKERRAQSKCEVTTPNSDEYKNFKSIWKKYLQT